MVGTSYKETDIGKIPEDWKVFSIAEVAGKPLQNGLFFEKKRKGKGVSIVNVGDLYKKAPIAMNTLEKFDATFDELARFSIQSGDIFFTRSSIVPSGIAFCNWVFEIDKRGVVFDSHVVRLSPDCSIIEPAYLYSALLITSSRRQFLENSKTATMTTIDQRGIERCRIPVPELYEQKAIAGALSDVDALIDSLEELIAKKRAIKTATMQELLTGKTRLPGFEDRWQECLIGSFTTLKAGGTPSTKVNEYWGGNILWMSSGELHLKFVEDVQGRITNRGLVESAATLLPKKCVLIGLAGQGKTRGTAALNRVPLTTNQSVAAIYPSRKHSSEFLFYNIDNRYEELRELSSGDGGRGGLNLTILSKIKVSMPCLKEQQAIADVLLDIDRELTSLETKLRNIKGIKQGMMQELLTGRTRLVS